MGVIAKTVEMIPWPILELSLRHLLLSFIQDLFDVLLLSQWIILSVMLAILTIFFHWLLIIRRNQSKQGWKRVDYIWLIVAFVGVYGSSMNIVKTQSNEKLSRAIKKIDVETLLLKKQLNDLRKFPVRISGIEPVNESMNERALAHVHNQITVSTIELINEPLDEYFPIIKEFNTFCRVEEWRGG